MTSVFFFFNDTATTEIYTLSLHDALPICRERPEHAARVGHRRVVRRTGAEERSAARCRIGQGGDLHIPGSLRDRKSTRLNSSHSQISYAVFCLKKKKHTTLQSHTDYGSAH